jgi:MoaA/NifB/PqqE/SkfB family radical SAM enzyme
LIEIYTQQGGEWRKEFPGYHYKIHSFQGEIVMAKSILSQGKNFVSSAKRETAENVLSQSLNLLGHTSEKNYVRFADAFQKIAGDNEQQTEMADWIRRWISNGPGGAYMKRVLTQMNPKMRKNFIAKLMVAVFFRPEDIWENFKAEVGIAPPVTVLISPTMRCNYLCTGCYAANYTKDDDMAPELFDRVIQEAKDTLGIRFFTISGGEPFTYPPLLDAFKKHSDCAFQVFTNGSLLTDAVCDKLAELGNVAPCISIEGTEELTDQRRGNGAYQRVLKAMDRLRERGIVFAYSATATSLNVDFITSDEFCDLMIEKGAYYGWYFSYIPIGLNPDMKYMPTPEQRNQLRIGVTRLRNTKPILLADFWNDGAMTGGCIASGRQYFHVNNKGDVEPCVFCHFSTHNVKDVSLMEALKSPFLSALRSKQPFNHNLLKPCPLIDNPKVMRWAVESYGAHPTHQGAESLVTSLADGLDKYSADLGALTDPIWEKDFRPWTDKWEAGIWGDGYKNLTTEGDPDKIKME